MAIVDELVTQIRFEVEQLAALANVEKKLDGVESGVKKVSTAQAKGEKSAKQYSGAALEVGKSWGIAEGVLSATGKAVGVVTDGIKSLGLASVATTAIMGVWGLGAAANARNMANVAFKTGLTTKELQKMGSVYEQLGMSAKSFEDDAANYRAKTGRSLTLERMIKLADKFKRKTPQNALNFGIGVGINPESIQVLMKGGEFIKAKAAEAERLGHVNTKEQLDSLNELNAAIKTAKTTADSISTGFAAGMSTGLTPAINQITEALAKNKDSFEAWGLSLGSTIRNLTAGAVSSFEQLNKALEAERTPEAVAVMTSPDPKVREENIKRLEKIAAEQSLGNKVSRVGNTFKALVSDDVTLDDVGRTHDSAEDIIQAPVNTARHLDQLERRGPDSFWIDHAAEGIKDAWRGMMLSPNAKTGVAEQFSEQVAKRGLTPEWGGLTKEERPKFLERIFRDGAWDESIYQDLAGLEQYRAGAEQQSRIKDEVAALMDEFRRIMMSDDFGSYSIASAWGGDPLAGRQKDADAFFARIQEEGLAGNYLQLKGANKQDVAGMVYRGSPDEAVEAVRNHAPTGGQERMPGGMGSEERRYSPPDDPPSDFYRIPPAAGNTIYNQTTGPDINVELSVTNYGVKGVERATAEVEAAALRGTKSALQLAATRMSIGNYS